jgi:hypothetical protein
MNSLLRFLSLGLIAAAVAWAGPKHEESLTVFESRKIALAVPEGFSFKTNSDDAGLTVVQLAAAKDKVTASLVFLPDADRQFATSRGRAEKMVEEFQEFVDGSVEKAMQFEELEPKGGAGTYCVFTDAKLVGQTELPPNEFHHLTCGLKSWPGAVVIFRVFSNDTASPEYQAVMKMLRESVLERTVPLR